MSTHILNHRNDWTHQSSQWIQEINTVPFHRWGNSSPSSLSKDKSVSEEPGLEPGLLWFMNWIAIYITDCNGLEMGTWAWGFGNNSSFPQHILICSSSVWWRLHLPTWLPYISDCIEKHHYWFSHTWLLLTCWTVGSLNHHI